MENYFHYPFLHKEEAFHYPKWLNSTIWYQIFPERFDNGSINIYIIILYIRSINITRKCIRMGLF